MTKPFSETVFKLACVKYIEANGNYPFVIDMRPNGSDLNKTVILYS
jgi:hypothetical protein